ncbi:MAG: alpha/beta hydrolase [Candidatus Omnitrophica bacterium]|nr:alpha/beta hydrolase [Candidatus Omnitrophota bacterium]MBU4334474.1 alpha/beta hydrolase [Candidatus Omnitrophota bacterium]
MRLLIYLAVFLFLFVLYVRYLEQKSLFYPKKDILVKPDSIGLSYEDIYFKTKSGIVLNGWLVEGSPQSKAVMLFFHGNAGNIGDRLTKLNYFAQMGINVFIIDYRGYGKSEGSPNEEGLYEDATAAFDYLVSRKDLDPEKIIAYGVSLGGAVAVDLASNRNVAALIVDSSFSNAKGMAKKILPLVPGFIIKTKLDSLSKISRIEQPKLFLHSPQDEVVPFALGRKLYESAPEPKEFVELSGGHNDNHLEDESNYKQKIKLFINKIINRSEKENQ